jgi:ribosome-associated toxin RatA of RatAB toxin-antitoxin module
MFKTLTNEWKIEPYSHTENQVKLSSQWSKLTFYINFEFNSILYTNLSKGYFNEISTKMMKSFENRCEEVYGNK